MVVKVILLDIVGTSQHWLIRANLAEIATLRVTILGGGMLLPMCRRADLTRTAGPRTKGRTNAPIMTMVAEMGPEMRRWV
ncbi:hypothetical protein C1J02_07450 [Sulfitobacter sp. SK011]|nr:hypothetical protein C1J02_07450 [Sulfitobacter sp. SK011]